MADITRLRALQDGLVRGVDLTQNSLVAQSFKVTDDGGLSSSELTKAIVDKLLLINAAADADGTYDSRYTQISDLAAISGAALVGADSSGLTYSSSSDVQGVLSDLDSQIGLNVTGIGNNSSAIALKADQADVVLKAGSSMDSAANLTFSGGGEVLGLPSVPSATAAASKEYVDAQVAAIVTDAADITYTPAILANWNGTVDPGNVAPALDQLAARMTVNDAKVSADGSVTSHSDVSDAGSGQIITASERTQIGTNQSDISTLQSTKADEADVVLRDGSQAFTADQSMGNNKLTNLAAPIAPSDAARLQDIQDAAAGIIQKDPVRMAATSNVDIATGGLLTIDTITAVDGDRVLLPAQSDATQNGIYVASSGSWSRSEDFDGTPSSEVQGGALVFVTEGTTNGFSSFRLQGTGELAVGVAALNWSLYSRAEATQAGDGLNKTGLTFSVDVNDIAGAGLVDDGSNNLTFAASVAGVGLQISAGVLSLDFSEFDSDDIVEGSSNLFYTESRFDSSFAGKSTSDLSEGTNLYYTQARFDSAFAAKSSDDLSEGSTNLYYTQARFDSAFSAKDAGDLNYNQTDANDWTVASGSSIESHLDEVGQRLVELEDGVNSIAAQADAGETITSGLKAVRYMRSADAGFVAGRIVSADKDASSSDDFFVAGLIAPSVGLSAGDSAVIVKAGVMSVISHGLTVGEPFYLDASGALSSTAPSAVDEAVVRCGMVIDANTLDVRIDVVGVN